MKRTVMAAAIAMIFGSATSVVLANPTNDNSADSNRAITQSATANSTQGGDGSPQANENSTASQDNNSDNSTKTITKSFSNSETKTISKSDSKTINKTNMFTHYGDANAAAGAAAANHGGTAQLWADSFNTKVE